MRHPKLSAVRNCNNHLLQSSSKNYWKLLQVVATANKIPNLSGILGAIRSRDFIGLVSIADSLSSQMYDDAAQHYAANQFALLIRKYPFPGVDKHYQPERAAYTKFLASEHKCSWMNRFFRARRSTGRYVNEDVFDSMRKFIGYVLPNEPNYVSWTSQVGFGPGASIGVHGSATNIGRKLLAQSWTVTPGAFTYAYSVCMNHAQMREALLPSHGGFSSGNPKDDFDSFVRRTSIVRNNNIEFVPKTVKTFRSIAVEPLLNGFLQKGVDKYMRLLLKRVGIDLSDQGPNAEMARLGSLDDSEEGFVTIDLSSASDSISIELCREVLPPAWFHLLDGLRSKEFAYKGVQRPFSKFCSMGNGFCFPLQTLLFASMCATVGAGNAGLDFRVYGDDIVVRKKYSGPLLRVLRRCGFSPNKDKTFLQGPFRESCGKDWFGGIDVRPYTLDEPLDCVESIYKFLNLTLSNEKWELFFHEAREYALWLLPEQVRFWRPYPGNVDSGLDSSGDEHLTSPTCRWINGAWRWLELRHSAVRDTGPERHEHGSSAVVYAALSGSPSDMLFAFRRKTKTSVSWKTHSGSTSTWIPPRRFEMICGDIVS